MKNYFEKLKDPRWQKRRLECLQAKNWTCESCGDKDETLHVHHTIYKKGLDPWGYDDNFLKVLCERCHEATHCYKDLIVEALGGYSSGQLRILFLIIISPNMWGLQSECLDALCEAFSDPEITKKLASDHRKRIENGELTILSPDF